MTVALLAVMSVVPVSAQEAVPTPHALSASGQDYLQAVGRRVDSDVRYFDPRAAAPPLETAERVPPEQNQDSDGINLRLTGLERWQVILVTVAILLAIGYLWVRYGAPITVSLKGEADDAARARRGLAPRDQAGGGPTTPIQTILNMKDRQAAVILLARAILARVVDANGLLLQRSWTAREALCKLPRTQPHLDALRELVLASERVQFGNRKMTEDEFRKHADRVRPLWQMDTG